MRRAATGTATTKHTHEQKNKTLPVLEPEPDLNNQWNYCFCTLRRATAFLVLVSATQLLLAAPQTFFNVVLPEGADPWVIHHEGYYYLTVTTQVNITLIRSKSLSGLGGGERKVIWVPPSTGPDSKNLWAPELHHVKGNWYVYFAADDGSNENHRMFALQNSNPNPFEGEFLALGKVFDAKADRWAIDGTLLNADGKQFFIWSGWEGFENVQQNLYIAPMSDPVTINGPRVQISSPKHAWEAVGTPHVNEGPEAIIRNGVVYLIYSASGSWTDDYCLGLLTAKVDSDLLSPSSWTKHDQPVFRRGNGIQGPGHASFVKSPDGKEDWIVYHAARFQGSGWTRNIRIQPFNWLKNGLPNFGTPVSPNIAIPIPSGDPHHTRFEGENATFGGTVQAVSSSEASNKSKVVSIDTPESFLDFRVLAESEGKHVLSVRFGNGTVDRKMASHNVLINGDAVGKIFYPHSGWDKWSNAFLSFELQKGENTIRFTKGDGFGEIDSLDVFLLQK